MAMELSASRRGGIAGLNEELGPSDSANLSGELRQRIEELIRKVGFFGLPQPFPMTSSQSDAMSYSLTIATPDETRTVSWDDNHAAPSELHELIRALEDSGATWHPGPVPWDAASADPPGGS